MSAAVVLAAAGLVACGGGGGDGGTVDPRLVNLPTATGPSTPPVVLGDAFALAAYGERVISFSRSAPDRMLTSATITGVANGETLLGLDIRPANGLLYALGSRGTVYELNAVTGVATARSTLRAATGDDNPFTGLSGERFGLDFNPTVDRLRVVSNTGQNLRINVDTGETITDGAINPAGRAVTGVAYTNSFAGAATTQLYALDAAAGRLHLQDPPNNGTLTPGVTLGVTASGLNGFDIESTGNVGYAALDIGGEAVLYRIDLTATGNAATRVGPLLVGGVMRGLALAPR